MNLSKIIAGIKQNIAIRQKGVHADHVMVDRRELQLLMAHFDEMEAELRVVHARKARFQESLFSAVAGGPMPLVMGLPNAGSLKCPCQNYPMCACTSCIKLTPQQNGGFPTQRCDDVKHSQQSQPNLYRMITEQNPERRTEQRKPTTSLDWELQQALIHLQNAISVTDSRRGHLLQAAVSITKGVKESE